MAIEHTASGLAEPTLAAAAGGGYIPQGRGNPAPRRTARFAPTADAALPLSREAKRVRDGLGLPITALPGVEREERAYLHEHSQALNRLIVGQSSEARVWKFLRANLPGASFDRVRSRARTAFSPLWDRDELMLLVDKNLHDLEVEWRRRIYGHRRWSAASKVIKKSADYAAIWRDILGGDFDLRGRGAEYTKGMESFQASRWMGARTLLDVLGARGGAHGVYLDVLGGDGYVWRLLEAERGVAETRLFIVEDDALFVESDDRIPAATRELMDRLLATDPRVVVLVVRPEDGATEEDECRGEMRYRARLLSGTEGRIAVTQEMVLPAVDLMLLVHAGEAAWLSANGPAGSAPLADRAAALLQAARDSDGGALVITNDISPHMFYRAGLWGLPTREDATQLSRTFLPDSLDGVLFAYGTHHIPDMFDATREACAVMKPGATVVVHDFFDEGPAGQWFHHVVDKHSKTGHDIPHIGPVQMAVVLFAAGFQDVELHETQDPFFFACDGEEVKAKDLALSYLLGMYGMEESFRGRLEEFEQIVKTVLTYPEVGETPIFTDDFVYIPRRAVVAKARRPENGAAPKYSESDRVLISGIAELFRQEPAEILRRANTTEEVGQYWFGKDGSRWGISPERQRAWLDWAAGVL